MMQSETQSHSVTHIVPRNELDYFQHALPAMQLSDVLNLFRYNLAFHDQWFVLHFNITFFLQIFGESWK